ncbi:MAG: hypothetical protein QM811_22555 [Pirellulales bacterium]
MSRLVLACCGLWFIATSGAAAAELTFRNDAEPATLHLYSTKSDAWVDPIVLARGGEKRVELRGGPHYVFVVREDGAQIFGETYDFDQALGKPEKPIVLVEQSETERRTPPGETYDKIEVEVVQRPVEIQRMIPETVTQVITVQDPQTGQLRNVQQQTIVAKPVIETRMISLKVPRLVTVKATEEIVRRTPRVVLRLKTGDATTEFKSTGAALPPSLPETPAKP